MIESAWIDPAFGSLDFGGSPSLAPLLTEVSMQAKFARDWHDTAISRESWRLDSPYHVFPDCFTPRFKAG